MKKLKVTKETISISLILLLSLILNFGNIGIEGYGNNYYAAGVKSMTMSLKNFFFVSFDPGSFVTIDKPPMGFWIQTIFAKIFGYSGWSIILPQALAGVISVYLIYYLVKKSFGFMAGIISAICLAITPVFVAASRNNTIDNLLVLTLLFACIGLTKAIEKGKVKYLYLSLILVGIGFNIKMLEAYMIGPAIYITYLLSSIFSFKKKILQLFIGTIILFSVSLSWAVIVDLVPAQNRPFVGSSTNNSVMELIIGHNGLERLGLSGRNTKKSAPINNNKSNKSYRDEDNQNQSNEEDTIGNQSLGNNGFNQENLNKGINNQGGPPQGNNNQMGQEQGGGPGPGGPGGPGNSNPGGGLQGSFGGQTPAGLGRLFSKNSLSDQIVWFLPFAFLGFIASLIKEKLKIKLDNKRKVSLVLWFVWLFPEYIYFSYTTGLFHPYYLTMMAPPIAALTGIGVKSMWELYKEENWKSWFLPITFAIEGITQMMMLLHFTSSLSNLIRNIILISIIACFIASLILGILNLINILKKDNQKSAEIKGTFKVKESVFAIALISIMITPFIGSSASVIYGVNSTIPVAGLELLSNNEKKDEFSKNKKSISVNTDLIDYLQKNRGGEKFLLAVSSSKSADSIIITTGEPIMAIGGYSGSDNILTLDEFKNMVKNGEVRYVLTGGEGRGGNNEIMNWVKENGTQISESEYSSINSNNSNINKNDKDRNQGSETLYDLKSIAETL